MQKLYVTRDMGILSKAMITKYPEMLEDTKQRFRNFPDNHPKPIRMENWNWMLPGTLSLMKVLMV